MMKQWTVTCAALLSAVLSAADATVPVDPVRDLLEFAPEAEEYTVLYDADCFSGNDNAGKKYLVNNSEKYEKIKPAKIGYFLRLEGTDGTVRRVFATVDPFAEKIIDYGFPRFWPPHTPIQKEVRNLTVKTDVPGVKTGNFPKGNVEIWNVAYSAKNSAGVPGASDTVCDFGDSPFPGHYGVFQLHNTAEKQTVFAVNHWFPAKNTELDVGIGNGPGENPDWTRSCSGANFKSVRMLILIKPQP